MTGTLIGYARCSTDEHDSTAQRAVLAALGVPAEQIHLDRGFAGTHRDRPGLDQALAAVCAGDMLVAPTLARLARSLPDAHAIGGELVERGVALSLGGQVHDPNDPIGRLFFDNLATFAEFEVERLGMRTREGMATARANGKLKGRRPKLSNEQQAELVRLHAAGEHSVTDLADVFSISRPTVYRIISRARAG